MDSSSSADGARRFRLRTLWISAGATVLLIVLTAAVSTQHHRTIQKDKFQSELCTRLNIIQLEIAAAAENKDRQTVRSIALEYERLGSIFAELSSHILGSYFDTGEWGTIARILVGNSASCELFKAFDGPLTEEEIRYLERLSGLNKQLLSELCSGTEYREVTKLSIQSLRDVLNGYQLHTLRDFLAE